MVPPLPPGTLLGGRFQLVRTLGEGGFSIAYLAKDTKRGDSAVVKELAPPGSSRDDLVLRLPEPASRLRRQFIDEAGILARLNLRGVLPVRAVLEELGTAYFATDHAEGAKTLDRVLLDEGRLSLDGALDILFQLAETLEHLHGKGLLHRDIKPSNILLTPRGDAILIDFGSAREWHADHGVHHTVLFTPGYAPLEQLSEHGRRGPATDIYALCATAYHLLVGVPPPPSTDRANGAPLPRVRSIRPDVEEGVAAAIEAGLGVRYADRPQSIEVLRALLSQMPSEAHLQRLEEMDDRRLRLNTLSYARRQCPRCAGVLQDPKPLPRGVCGVCGEGRIRTRVLPERLCPSCGAGRLAHIRNGRPLAYCPMCTTGRLRAFGKRFGKPPKELKCERCGSTWKVEVEELRLAHSPKPSPLEAGSEEDWRAVSGRTSEVWQCDGCDASFDVLADGRWRAAGGSKIAGHESLYPEDWSRVAAGLDPGAGNACCNACDADYFLEGRSITLLSAHPLQNAYVNEYLGRLTDLEALRWFGVGKTSGMPGLVCEGGCTEFDREADYLRLVRSDRPALVRHIGEVHQFDDWHRLAEGLPPLSEEAQFEEEFDQAVLRAFSQGEIGFDSGALPWKGPAVRLGERRIRGTLEVRPDGILFGGLVKRWKAPMDAVKRAESDSGVLRLWLDGETEPQEFEVQHVELSIHLRSGVRTAVLGAENLAERIENLRRR